jgi:hypothetical protein
MLTRSRISSTLPTVYKKPVELHPEYGFIKKPKHVANTNFYLLIIYYIMNVVLEWKLVHILWITEHITGMSHLKIMSSKQITAYSWFQTFLHVLNVAFFLLGDSPASEFWILCAGVSEHSVTSNFLGGGLTPPMKMENTECSATSSLKIQTPGNPPKERIQTMFFL